MDNNTFKLLSKNTVIILALGAIIFYCYDDGLRDKLWSMRRENKKLKKQVVKMEKQLNEAKNGLK